MQKLQILSVGTDNFSCVKYWAKEREIPQWMNGLCVFHSPLHQWIMRYVQHWHFRPKTLVCLCARLCSPLVPINFIFTNPLMRSSHLLVPFFFIFTNPLMRSSRLLVPFFFIFTNPVMRSSRLLVPFFYIFTNPLMRSSRLLVLFLPAPWWELLICSSHFQNFHYPP